MPTFGSFSHSQNSIRASSPPPLTSVVTSVGLSPVALPTHSQSHSQTARCAKTSALLAAATHIEEQVRVFKILKSANVLTWMIFFSSELRPAKRYGKLDSFFLFKRKYQLTADNTVSHNGGFMGDHLAQPHPETFFKHFSNMYGTVTSGHFSTPCKTSSLHNAGHLHLGEWSGDLGPTPITFVFSHKEHVTYWLISNCLKTEHDSRYKCKDHFCLHYFSLNLQYVIFSVRPTVVKPLSRLYAFA